MHLTLNEHCSRSVVHTSGDFTERNKLSVSIDIAFLLATSVAGEQN